MVDSFLGAKVCPSGSMTSVAARHGLVASCPEKGKLTPSERLCSRRQLSRAWQILSQKEYVMAKRKISTFERLRGGKMSRQERKEWQQRLCAEDTGLEVVHPDAAGIDVGNASRPLMGRACHC
jgi:hypothetical protein